MVTKENFGAAGVDLYTIKNSNGQQVQITNYGARVVSWLVEKENAKPIDIVLGYADIAGYEADNKYMGAIVGRCANRIGNAQFELNGKLYQIDKNDGGKNHLHGGFNGFEKKIWSAEIVEGGVKFSCTSEDGEGGYPGNLSVTVTYTFNDENELRISYGAVSDADTLCNLTNHTYFNLNGFDSGTILNQRIQIFADEYTWANAESIPDGRILSVEGTPMDLRQLTKIGAHIDDDFDELNFGNGYDHNYCIKNYDGSLRKAAVAEGNELELIVYTTQPGLQFYAGNFLDGKPAGKGNYAMNKRTGFALEAQYFPNAINLPDFAKPILRKRQIWKAETIYLLKPKASENI